MMTSVLNARARALEFESSMTAKLPGAGLDLWAWQLRAACRGTDGSWFFPPEREQEKARSKRIAKAKAVCARCPVMAQCRTYAMTVGEPFGVWGGLCEEERQQSAGPSNSPSGARERELAASRRGGPISARRRAARAG